MAVVLKIGNKFSETCDECRLFVNKTLGMPAYCIAGGKYTDKEIKAEKDGNLNMYYHGCLKNRPKNCPLFKTI